MTSFKLCTILVLTAAGAEAADNAPSTVPLHQQATTRLEGYLLGANDQLKIEIAELDESNGRTYRVDPDGTVSVPLVGRIKIAGETLADAERQIEAALRSQIREPHVSLTLVETRSQPVSIVGAVNNPGVHQLEGSKTLFEVLALAGGLKPEAGYQLRITRKLQWGPIPMAGVVVDTAANVSTVEIPASAIQDASAAKNIRIYPDDVISVPRADIVYVVGEVRKGGAIVLRQRNAISVTEALSAAEGFSSSAAPKNARILRPDRPPAAVQRSQSI